MERGTIANGCSKSSEVDRIARMAESMVNHPSHYNQGRFEVIEVIEDQRLGFHLGNAIKYICRAGKKSAEKTVEDLEKAVWYIQRFIEIQKTNPRRPNDMNPRKSEMEIALDKTVREFFTGEELDKAIDMAVERIQASDKIYSPSLLRKVVRESITAARMRSAGLVN